MRPHNSTPPPPLLLLLHKATKEREFWKARSFLCADGILSADDTCCAASCGTCGGRGCKLLEGGKDLCCTATIRRSERVCAAAADVGCRLPTFPISSSNPPSSSSSSSGSSTSVSSADADAAAAASSSFADALSEMRALEEEKEEAEPVGAAMGLVAGHVEKKNRKKKKKKEKDSSKEGAKQQKGDETEDDEDEDQENDEFAGQEGKAGEKVGEESMFDRLVLLTVADQEAIAKVSPFVASVPWDHFGRKNVGYLYAIRHGAKAIFDFDDDNILYSLEVPAEEEEAEAKKEAEADVVVPADEELQEAMRVDASSLTSASSSSSKSSKSSGPSESRQTESEEEAAPLVDRVLEGRPGFKELSHLATSRSP